MSSHPEIPPAQAVAVTVPDKPPTVSRTRPPSAPAVMIWFALGVVYVIWGSTYFGIRIMARHLPGLGASAVRFLIAGLILGLVLTLRRGRGALKVTPRQFAAAGLV